MDNKQSVYEDRVYSRQAMTSTFYSNFKLQQLPLNKVKQNSTIENQNSLPGNYSLPPQVPPPNEYQYIYRNQNNSQLDGYKRPRQKYHSSHILQRLLHFQQPDSEDFRMNSTQFKQFMEQRNSIDSQTNQKQKLLRHKNKRLSYQGSLERENKLQIQEDEDSLFKKVHIQPKTSVDHHTRVNISQQISRMKKVIKQKKAFSAYSQAGMTKSFSVNKHNDYIFEMSEKGRNTNVKAFTTTGYSSNWMIHNGQKQNDNNNDKASLVIIRQKPRCLSSLGDEREAKEEAGNTRYQDFKKARVQTSCSAPMQDNENYDTVAMDISTKENHQIKSNNVWNQLGRPGTQMGIISQNPSAKPMSSALKLRAREFNHANRIPQSTDPMQQTQMSFNSANFQNSNPHKTMYVEREKNRIEKQIEDMKFKMVKMKEKNQMMQGEHKQINPKREVKFEVIREEN